MTESVLIRDSGTGNLRDASGPVTISGTGIPQGGPLTTDLNANSHKITNLTDPASAQDATTKAYVDALVNGAEWKQQSRLATTAALPANTYSNGSSGVGATLTGVAFGALSIDGVTPAVNDRVLVKNEAAPANNGIYTVTVVGAIATLYVLTRATDYNQAAEVVAGTANFVTEGTANADTAWVQTTTGTITMGSTSLVFAQFGSGGAPSGTAGGVLDGTYPNPGLAAAVAGSGLAETSDVLSVNVDGSTIEINSDALRVKAGGIGANELASTAVTPTTYGDASHVGQFTVDADGRITAASSVAIPGVGTGGSVKLYDFTISGSDQASIDTNVDGTTVANFAGYDILEVFMVIRTDDATGVANPTIIVNNDASALYDRQVIRGNNATAVAAQQLAGNAWTITTHGTGGTASYATSVLMVIPGYAATTFFKAGTLLDPTLDATAASNYSEMWAIGYRSTNAITRIKIAAAGAQKLKVGSRVMVYGR